MTINHCHSFGRKNQDAYIRLEGTKGATKMTRFITRLSKWKPEELEIKTENTDWVKFDINGKWFPDAFIGVMSNMQRFKNGEDDKLITSIDDSIDTMAVVDSCGISMSQED